MPRSPPPAAAPSPPAAPALSAWWRALRPGFLLLTLIACGVGVAASHADGVALSPSLALASALFAVIAHAAANVWNDCGDAALGTDAVNTGRVEPYTGGSRVIQNGELSLAQMRALAVMLGLVAVWGGGLLAWLRGPGLLAIGLVGAAIGYAYSQPRLALMSRGVGELAVGVAWALVVIGADFVQRGDFARLPLLASVSLGLLVAAVLLINQVPDIEADAICGKRTLAVRLGPVGALRIYGMLVLAAYAWTAAAVLAGALPAGAAASLVTLPLGLLALRRGQAHVRCPAASLRPALQWSVLQALGHGALFALGLGMPGH